MFKRNIQAISKHADMEVVEYLSDTFDFGICSPKQEWINETIDSRKPGSLNTLL